MGKAGRWLRSFFVTGRKGRKAKDRADCQSASSAALLPASTSTPSAREKRRWSFRRPAAAAVASKVDAAGGQATLAPSASQCFSEAEVRLVVVQEQDQRATVPEVVALPPPSASEKNSGAGDGEELAAAAIKIQSAFRSYLARKALCALRGMLKLQAMVRGQLVRRQASVTLRRMQVLVDAQMRARAERLRLLDQDDDGEARHLAATTPPSRRRSPQHARARKPPEETAERSSDVTNVIKIVEVDDGAPRAASARRGGSWYSTPPPSRAPAKAELYEQKASPTLTDASASGRLDDASVTSASEPASCRRKAALPSYMANTESSRAKQARSQSAPRQRFFAALDQSGASAAASPSPSCGERMSGDARRRASLDPLDLPGARAAVAAHRSSLVCVERCASRARARAGLSLPSSECGSSAWRD